MHHNNHLLNTHTLTLTQIQYTHNHTKMASAAFMNSLKRVPVPLFGSATTAVAWTGRQLSVLPKLAPWALPLSVGGMWFVWPAVDEEWKQSIGLGSSPAAPAPAAEEEKKVELSSEAQEKIEKAYVVEGGEEKKELTDEEKAVMKAVAAGDYSLLEKEWEAFQQKACVPGDGDDDDDDDDDDDEDDEDDDDEDDEE